ncbi:MAG: transglutaminase-like domain-containing protein [Desulfopila sp.]
MRKLQFLALTLLLLAVPCTTSAADQAASTITMAFDLSDQPADQDVRLWTPYPLSDANQLITDISVSGDYAEAAVSSDQKYSTPMLFARWDAATGAVSRKLVFSFHVIRQEVLKKNLPTAEVPWSPADYSEYLTGTRLGPIDGVVKKLADQIVAGKTGVYAKAKAIYDWTCENMYRDPETEGCGAGDVCALIARPGGKCTDIHSVFVSLCRAAGVPAREIFGIRLGKTDGEDITTWQHCWAEFFLPGSGWVPVDPADVRKKMLVEKLEPGDARTAAYRDYFWGGWDAYRVKLAVGRDLVLNPQQAGAPLNTFGYPYAEVGGKPLDWLEPATFKYTITSTR